VAVKHLGERYQFPNANAEENYGGAINLYFSWADHMLFVCPMAVPVPPSMPFSAFVSGVMKLCYAAHPDFEKIDWNTVEWSHEGKDWKPDFDATLAENGLRHMSYFTFRTPGLLGLQDRKI
jgi:phenol hydroxylase P4 protein